ncbi:uncharacterized protein N7484_008474 [Penicillium longicatenatum]|uniref:uncharacterized protein n=1 Tax=Penicillium longicatenatum TaxID=1561947 RepID=UPI0025474C2D|nr:uncharacterized protein N7484_008474 [Penicillium longicatenatum]KAJ5635161.1 hypothetical protein N7484_008474 [Penicillium longicatenatum]
MADELAKEEIHPSVIDAAKASFGRDRPMTDDVRPGDFFDDPDYLETLPHEAKALICAVQEAGDHPDRPGLCHIQSELAFTRYQQSQSEDDLSMALALEALSLRYVPAQHPGRGKSNHHMGDLYVRKWKTHKNDVTLDEAIRHYKLALLFAQEKDEVLCEWACDLAVVQLERYKKTKQVSDKKEAHRYFDRAIELAGQLPVRARHISNKGHFLYLVVSGSDIEREAQLTESIAVHQEAIQFCDNNPGLSSPPQLPYGMIYRNAGLAYIARFSIAKGGNDGKRGSSLIETALSYEKAGDGHWEDFTNELANAQKLIAQASGDLDPDEIACDVWRRAIEISPTAITPRIHLARSYHERAGNLVDQSLAQELLQRARGLAEDTIRRLPPGHRNTGLAFSCCALVHYSLYDVRGEVTDIDAAIECAKKAVRDENDVNLWDRYRLLAQVLILRYERLNNGIDMLDASAAAMMGLSKCPPEDIQSKAECIWVAAKISRANYDQTRDLDVLKKTCDGLSGISRLMSKGSTSRALLLNDLGNAYTQLFSHEALPSQLEQAIDAYGEALSELKSLHGNEQHPNIFMLNAALGNVMTQRFLHWKATADIESAIKYYQRSLSKIDRRNPRYSIRVVNLCYALQLRFDVKRDLKDLKEAQKVLHLALEEAAPLSVETKKGLSMHLGNVYQFTFKVTGQRADLENAIDQYNKALVIDGASSASTHGMTLLNKAVALQQLALMTGSISDFKASEKTFENVEKLFSEDDPNFWKAVLNHANLIKARYERKLGANVEEDAFQALEKYENLARMAIIPASVRISVASIAAKLATDELNDPLRARDNILISLKLLPEAILMHESRLKQLEFIREYQLIPGAVASLSLSAGDPPSTVIHRLEAARAFIWDRIQDRPTRIDDLLVEQPELAERFRTLQQRMFHQTRNFERSNTTDLTSVGLDDVDRMHKHHNTDSYREVIEQIRALPGFSSFLKIPDSSADIQSYAHDAPIVFINVTAYRSDAIVISRDDVHQLALPDFNMEQVKAYFMRFAIALHHLGNAQNQVEALSEYQEVMKWLWESAAKPVLGIINWGKYDLGPFGKPRIIWASIGWLSVLPIHAAGDFETPTSSDSNEPRCVHDVVVSSYTNSLKALDFTRHITKQRKDKSRSSNSPQALIAAMATTPGFGPEADLTVEPEISAIRNIMLPLVNVEVLMQPSSATIKAKITPETAILHFACHARADDKDPSRSAILLQDHQTKPSPFSVRTILNLDLKACELVYLSACESGLSKVLSLRDEGIHIAGAFHIAGVSHVISTLWKVSDTVSAELAELFYLNLKGPSCDCLDSERAPYALHEAIGEMRQKGVHPIFWAAFVHSGP